MLYRSFVLTCSVVLVGAVLGAGSAGAQTTWYADDDADLSDLASPRPVYERTRP